MFEGIIQKLIDELSRLPGVGRKSAQRIAFHILQRPQFDVRSLAQVLLAVREQVKSCEVCGNLTESVRCAICCDPRRNLTQICVVEEPIDVVAIEKSREFRGLYHVLGGVISPIDGVGPEQLRIGELLLRVKNPEIYAAAPEEREISVVEVIVATNPKTEGEATATYLTRLLSSLPVRVTRIAFGLPMGGNLEYADEVTLGRALAGRRQLG